MRDLYYQIHQLSYQLGEDWMYDFDGVYEAAEAWVRGRSDEGLRRFVAEVDLLFESGPSATDRRRVFDRYHAFSSSDDSFDVWLRAVQTRATEALAGIHSHPLVDPEPPADAGTDPTGIQDDRPPS